MTMETVLYVYDCINSRQRNARRIAFTKELYGYTYTWKTRGGLKTRRKPGLVDSSPLCEVVTDSAIMVPVHMKDQFDQLFANYRDILKVRAFSIERELPVAV